MCATFFFFLLNNFQKMTPWALFNGQKEGVTPFIVEKPKKFYETTKHLPCFITSADIFLIRLWIQIFFNMEGCSFCKLGSCLE